MEKIKSIRARQILDCKARPALEVEIETESGFVGVGCAPTGSSVGSYESYILRDNDKNKFDGMSVYKAVDLVNNNIANVLKGMDVFDLKAIDTKLIEMDGTEDKHNLGGNTIYSISIACFKIAALIKKQIPAIYLANGVENIKHIPIPSFNLINGGKHKSHTQPFNETMMVPYKAKDMQEVAEISTLVHKKIGELIEKYYHDDPRIGGSYGWLVPTSDPEENLKIMAEAVEQCGYTDKVCYAFDCASSEMYDKNTNTYYLKEKRVSSDEIIDFVKGITERWNMLFVEDILDENDWDGFKKAHESIKKTIIIGDDFIATNPKRLEKAIKNNCIDGFIMKPNQVGSLTEAFEAYEQAKVHGIICIPSGRAGGVFGDIVTDLAIGFGSPFMKSGCPRSGERIAKINYLIGIQDKYPQIPLSDLTKVVRF